MVNSEPLEMRERQMRVTSFFPAKAKKRVSEVNKKGRAKKSPGGLKNGKRKKGKGDSQRVAEGVARPESDLFHSYRRIFQVGERKWSKNRKFGSN
jgi:hypothetical protein